MNAGAEGTVTVVGTATAPATPDRAVVLVGLERLAAGRAEALTDVAERAARVEAILAELGVLPADWVTAGVVVREQTEWRQERSVRVGFVAATQVRVTLTDPATIGRLATRAAEEVGAGVDGPTWVVDLDNPARSAARAGAASDARRRAADYAEALGLRLGDVVAVAEPGALRPPGGSGPEPRFAMAAAAAADVPVHSGDLDVHAAVQVTFALLPG